MMAGVYIHIPFCKQACNYCDFHFSTSLQTGGMVMDAMRKEIAERSSELDGEKIETIYFGGGTPSLLPVDEINRIIESITSFSEVDPGAEITLEANPDDLSQVKLSELRSTPVNRFSIGIQSFREEDLRYMNRAHNASQAEYSVKAAQDKGFENITIDLIYGGPTLPDHAWLENLQKGLELQVPHISSYALTVEQNTPLEHLIRRKKLSGVVEADVARQFEILMDILSGAGFEQYEISNFSKQGFRSRHNSSYWEGKKYLGIGPSAHSFDGKKRCWNVSNNVIYAKAIGASDVYWEEEELSSKDRYNEFIMTNLRRIEGVSFTKVEQVFGYDYLQFLQSELKKTDVNLYQVNDRHLQLTRQGKLLADRISSDLFLTD